ncbi:hypothetical protein J4Q44_G00102380 [Coregonus suidteri]|uniref:Uncharacterized protein n=1 Tax=Coregonus suidteri TaxID=861788 RepID=A0AAN8R9T5_9TELE
MSEEGSVDLQEEDKGVSIHDRMPAIQLRVSSLVNNSRNNSPECLLPVDPQVKKAPKPSAGSKMKMGWLKSSTPSKRKALDTGEVEQEGHTGETRPEKQPKTAGSQ